jgi:Crp-like helix-turn-helix domain
LPPRVELPPLPASLAVLPFLFMGRQSQDPEWAFQAALATAAAAEQADTEKRNTLRRVAWLLCELGCQYARRTGDHQGAFPLPRAELARRLGIALCRVKRTLALLTISGVISADADVVRVLDWRRLCGAGAYDPARLGRPVADADADEEIVATATRDAEHEEPRLTVACDPACFVERSRPSP